MSLQAALMAVVVPYAAIAVAGWRGLRTHQRRAEEPEEAATPRPGFILGRTRLSVEETPVRATVTAALRDLDRTAARHLTHLSVAAADGIVVRADPLALHEVLIDIIGTAISRAPCGSVLISARLHGGRVEIGVTDDGPAKSADVLSAASETSRQIVALHGATLEARSTAYGGTEVMLRLLAPAAKVRSEANATQAASPVQPAQAASPVQPAQAASPVQPAQAASPVQPAQAAQGSRRNSVVGRSVRSSSSSEVGTV